MIIENVAASIPSRKVSNDEVVDLVRCFSKDFTGDLSKALRIVKFLLERSGLETRHWLAQDERPMDHLANAVDSALKGTPFRPADIDLLIYVGVGGGFRKKGNAYMVAKTLGIGNAECFDILDACMSWTRAVALANSLFKTRGLRNALIVNAEFNMIKGVAGFPENYSLRHPDEMDYLFPSYTIGEAATATLLLPSDPDNFSITFHSKPDYADLCMIPAAGYHGFIDTERMSAMTNEGRFSAQGAAMHDRLMGELPTLLEKSRFDPSAVDIVFTHTSSSHAWNEVGKRHGFADKIFHIYPGTGNVVSASIPASMALARAAGKLSKGDRIAFLMGSAGMSFAASSFTF